jgi:DHA1 family multidrug resistance protein-like MFS transporter
VLSLFGCIVALRLGQWVGGACIALGVRELGPLSWVAETARDLEHANDRTTAIAFSILAVAQLVASPLWGRLADRYGPLRCLSILAAVLGVVLVATGLVHSIVGFLWLRTAASLCMAGSMTLAYAAVGKHVPAHHRALGFASAQSSIQLGLSIGPIAGGIIAVHTGLGGLFEIAGAELVATAVLIAVMRRRLRACAGAGLH